MKIIAQDLDKELQRVNGEKLGFAVFVFEFGKPGIANYISNAPREDMITALEEKAKIFKEKRDFGSPTGN